MPKPVGSMLASTAAAVMALAFTAIPQPASAATTARTVAPARCAALSQTSVDGAVGAKVSILRATPVAATASLPAYCEIEARIAPAVGTIVRLPMAGGSGKLLVGGCGNLCGEIRMEATEDALARGYTVAQTDMGHKGQDIRFGDDPAALDDFAWRGTHVTTLLAKALFETLYGNKPERSYFRGCSTGGRQALTEALMFPNEFDGIIAGAPAHQMAAVNSVWALKANSRADDSPILDEPAIRLLHAGVLAACDAQDGRRDGVLDNPLQCSFKPSQLQCSAGSAAGTCLTPEQVQVADAIYGGVRTEAQRFYASMGFAKGSELGWIDGLVGRAGQSPWIRTVAANYMYRFKDLPDHPTRVQDLDFDRFPVKYTRIDSLPSFGDDAMVMRDFAQSGHKMIVYAGWADQALTPATTLDFVSAQRDGLGGAEALDPFMRLYMVPGFGHCGGGDGDGEIDYLSALENWVEKDTAPATLDAYRLKTPAAGPTRFPIPAPDVADKRTLAPYPFSKLPDRSAPAP